MMFIKLLKKNEFHKYKQIQPSNINEILDLAKYVRLKLHTKSI